MEDPNFSRRKFIKGNVGDHLHKETLHDRSTWLMHGPIL